VTDSKCPPDGEIRERLATVEAGLAALDRHVEARLIEIDSRFVHHNEFREQINKERGDYVTRLEVRWIIGTIAGLLAAVLSLTGLFVVRR
jgi:hypothetical protein